MLVDRRLTAKVTSYLYKTKNKIKPRVASKLTTMFFKCLHIFLFLDLGFFDFKTKRAQRISKAVSLTQCLLTNLAMIAVITVNFNAPGYYFLIPWFSMFTLHYSIYAFVFLVSDNKLSFYKFLLSLQEIDLRMDVHTTCRFELMLLIAGTVCFVFKIGFGITYCVTYEDFCLNPLFVSVYHTAMWYCIDIVLILNSLIFYMVYCRLSSLVRLVKEVRRAEDIVPYHYKVYKDILDLTEKIKSTFDPIVRAFRIGKF